MMFRGRESDVLRDGTVVVGVGDGWERRDLLRAGEVLSARRLSSREEPLYLRAAMNDLGKWFGVAQSAVTNRLQVFAEDRDFFMPTTVATQRGVAIRVADNGIDFYVYNQPAVDGDLKNRVWEVWLLTADGASHRVDTHTRAEPTSQGFLQVHPSIEWAQDHLGEGFPCYCLKADGTRVQVQQHGDGLSDPPEQMLLTANDNERSTLVYGMGPALAPHVVAGGADSVVACTSLLDGWVWAAVLDRWHLPAYVANEPLPDVERLKQAVVPLPAVAVCGPMFATSNDKVCLELSGGTGHVDTPGLTEVPVRPTLEQMKLAASKRPVVAAKEDEWMFAHPDAVDPSVLIPSTRQYGRWHQVFEGVPIEAPLPDDPPRFYYFDERFPPATVLAEVNRVLRPGVDVFLPQWYPDGRGTLADFVRATRQQMNALFTFFVGRMRYVPVVAAFQRNGTISRANLLRCVPLYSQLFDEFTALTVRSDSSVMPPATIGTLWFAWLRKDGVAPFPELAELLAYWCKDCTDLPVLQVVEPPEPEPPDPPDPGPEPGPDPQPPDPEEPMEPKYFHVDESTLTNGAIKFAKSYVLEKGTKPNSYGFKVDDTNYFSMRENGNFGKEPVLGPWESGERVAQGLLFANPDYPGYGGAFLLRGVFTS